MGPANGVMGFSAPAKVSPFQVYWWECKYNPLCIYQCMSGKYYSIIQFSFLFQKILFALGMHMVHYIITLLWWDPWLV